MKKFEKSLINARESTSNFVDRNQIENEDKVSPIEWYLHSSFILTSFYDYVIFVIFLMKNSLLQKKRDAIVYNLFFPIFYNLLRINIKNYRMGFQLEESSNQPQVLAKDANTKSDDWYELHDPRNPITKRRRENNVQQITEKRRLKYELN